MAVYAVDDYGRDPHPVAALSPLARLRWNVHVTGAATFRARLRCWSATLDVSHSVPCMPRWR